MRQRLKGDTGPSLLLQWASVLIAFAVVASVIGFFIYSADSVQAEVTGSVSAYRLAGTVNLLRTVDGGEAERRFTSPLSIRIEGDDVFVTNANGRERELEGYLVGGSRALGAQVRTVPLVNEAAYCVERPLGGPVEVKPCAAG